VGAVIETFNGSLVVEDRAFSSPSLAALGAHGARVSVPQARLSTAELGRLLPADWTGSDPLPIVCASVSAYAGVLGMRAGVAPLAPPPAAAAGAVAAAPSPSQPAAAEGTDSTSPAKPVAAGGAGETGSPPAAQSPAGVQPVNATEAAAAEPAPEPSPIVDRNVEGIYKWMFTPLADRADALEARLAEVEDAIAAHYGVRGMLAPVGATSQSEVVCVGRVCVDGDGGKLNPLSVVLEGAARSAAGSGRVLLDLREAPSFALFPGQVVGVRGINTRGDRMVVREVYCGAPLATAVLPAPTARALAAASSKSGPLRVHVAAGPFSCHGDLEFRPLEDLLAEAMEAHPPPDVLVLVSGLARVGQARCPTSLQARRAPS
jgi:hypothetical protein